MSTEAIKDLYDLGQRDFSNLDLSDVCLEKCFLCKVNFQGSNLSNANLRELEVWIGNFENVNFQGVDLYRANFERVDLNGANFLEANLSEASLVGLKIKRVFFYNTNLTNTEFSWFGFTEVYLNEVYPNHININNNS